MFNLVTFFKVSTILLFIFITVFFIFSSNNLLKQANSQRLSDALKVQTIIQDEVLSYVYGLQGAKGAIIVDNFKADPKNFNSYAKSRDYFSNFSGPLGFGYIRYLKSENLKEYALKNKNKFRIHPEVNTKEHMIVELLEPVGPNVNAFGFDISFEESRKAAALKAARTGKAILTKKIMLVKSKNVQPGFLYLLPVYDTISTPPDETQRMKHLVGWSFAPIELDSIVKKIAQKLPPEINVTLQVDTHDPPIKVSANLKNNLFFKEKNVLAFDAGGTEWKVFTISSLSKIEYGFILLLIAYLLISTLIGFGACYIYNILLGKEKLLTEKNMWIDAIVESAGHSIIATNAEGVILTFNTSAEKMLGYKSHEVIEKHNPGLFHDPEEVVARAKALSEELGRPIAPGFEVFIAKAGIHSSDINEWTYIRKNGERFTIRLCVTAIYNSSNTVIGYLGIAEDLTKEIEMSKIIDSQQVQMIERSKMSLLGEMAGGIAHEINTPLAIIVTLSSQLARDKENSDIYNKLMKIKETSERINKIVKGLKLYSRNSENDAMENVNLASLIELTIDLCRQKIFNAQITIKTDLDNQIFFTGKATEISQVILNLIGNSIDSIELLEERWIHIDAATTDSKIIISIKDSGRGIAPNIVEKMMNPFFTTKDVGKGTGLGLSISKGIIEMHSGHLYYDRKSEYTKFIIELPSQKNI